MALVQKKCDTPLPAALAPALADNAMVPIRMIRMDEGVVAAYSPAQMTRANAWAVLEAVYGALFRLIDVTPAEVTA
jgi:hypothetical protein